MSILEFLPIGLAVTGLALRYVLSARSASAVQAWEASLPRADKGRAQARAVLAARVDTFAAA